MSNKIQKGESLTADFSENTWTFEMQPNFEVLSGEFVIVPMSLYLDIIRSIEDSKASFQTLGIVISNPVYGKTIKDLYEITPLIEIN